MSVVKKIVVNAFCLLIDLELIIVYKIYDLEVICFNLVLTQ